MSRVVYLGGFGAGRNCAEKVGGALESYFEEVDVFTFSDQVIDPEQIRKASNGVDLITHSAGALALSKLNPNFAYLLNPPLPRRVVGLVGRSAVKTSRMFTPGVGLHNLEDLSSASAYSASSVSELSVHPVANFSQLPKISRFDAIDAAIQAKNSGVNSSLVWTTHDAFFRPTLGNFSDASIHSIPIAMLRGEHDEVILRPEKFLNEVLNNAN